MEELMAQARPAIAAGQVATVGKAAPEWPPPLAGEALYGLAGDIVTLMEPHTEADPVAILTNVLVFFGNAAGYASHFTVEKDKHGMRLFAVQVGDTAKGRKGVTEGLARDLFVRADPGWTNGNIATGLSTGEGLIWAVRDSIERSEPIREKGRTVGYETVLVDPGVSDKRLLVIEPELARTLKVAMREGNIVSPVLRQGWDSGTLRVLTKTSPARATEAHISIVGHITKEELLRYLDSSEAFNGFANRFLWQCVRHSKALPEGGHVLEDELDSLARRLMKALDFARGVEEMERDEMKLKAITLANQRTWQSLLLSFGFRVRQKPFSSLVGQRRPFLPSLALTWRWDKT